MDVTEKIQNYIKETFDIGDDPDFTNDVHLFDYGFVDSLGAIDIISFVEETWGIEITQKDLTLCPMNTIDEIAGVVKGKL